MRAVVQNQRTHRDRFDSPEAPRSGSLSTQVLFAYQLNWQSVLYVGYGDLRDVNGVQVSAFGMPTNSQNAVVDKT